MNSEYGSVGNISTLLNVHQIDNLNKKLEAIYNCPISLVALSSPSITPCGHTFSYQNIRQALENNKSCPLDRRPLTAEELVPNKSLENLNEILEQKFMVVFLAVQKIRFEHECSLSSRPLFKAVKLPCGHAFDQTFFSHTFEIKTQKHCYTCDQSYDVLEVSADVTTSELAEEEYPKYLEKVKYLNSNLESQVVDLQLDDRKEMLTKIFELVLCPISKKTITSPVTGKCGHTFDADSINEKSFCPLDNAELNKSNVVANLKFKEVLDLFNDCSQNKTKAPALDREDRAGVFLILKSNTTLKKIGNIAISLGLLKPVDQPWDFPQFRTFNGNTIPNPEATISGIQGLTKENIPIIHVHQNNSEYLQKGYWNRYQ